METGYSFFRQLQCHAIILYCCWSSLKYPSILDIHVIRYGYSDQRETKMRCPRTGQEKEETTKPSLVQSSRESCHQYCAHGRKGKKTHSLVYLS